MRRLALLLALVLAGPAQAAPRPLAREPHSFALAGDHVLVSYIEGRTLTVDALPAGRRVLTYEAPPGSRPSAHLAASAQRAAMTIVLADDTSDVAAAQALSGPALGPYTPHGPMTRVRGSIPWQHQIDGEHVFSFELRGSLLDNVVVVRGPEPRELALPHDAVFAGALVAYSEQAPDQGEDDIGRRLVLADWRTGQRVHATDLPDPIDQIALHPSGRVALTLNDIDGIYEVRPGAPPRRIFRRPVESGFRLEYAGDHLVFNEYGRLRVIDPSGRVRAFGTPTENFGGFTTDERRVLWMANGCLLLADVTESAATAPGPGPCPRSEVIVEDASNPHLGRSIPVKLRCVAAPTRCRGKLRLLRGTRVINRPLRYSIPAGRSRTIRVALTEPGYRLLRRAVARERGALVAAQPRGDDGDRFNEDGAKGILVLPRGAS